MSFHVLLKTTFLPVFYCILFGLSANVFGQSTVVSGKVTGPEGEPLQSASVSLKGSNIGTATAADGSFSLSLNKKGGEILIFTSVGFADKEVALGNSNVINVQLEANEQSLNTVVVVGYGTQKKKDVTGSVASVSKDRLQQLPNTNIAQALQGSVAGLQVVSNGGGAEGNNTSILIRGRNSITASSSPLIIWDGIPYSGSISEINPNDVASIDVLKDASATAIYGSRGSNGVIIVTSKQGKRGKLSVIYDGYYGTQTLVNKPDLLTGPEFYDFKVKRNGISSISSAEKAVYDAGAWVNWYDLATQTGIRQQHSLSVRGGSEKATFYLGGTYLNVKGVAVNDRYKRYSLRPSVDIKLASWLNFSSSSQITFQDRSGLPVEFDDTRSTGGGANFFNPLTAPYDSAGNLRRYAYDDNPQARNPLSSLLVKNADNTYKVFTANSLTVLIPFIQGLSYKLNTGVEYGNNQRKTYYNRNVALGFEKNGDAINFSSVNRNFTVENILNYTRNFGKHSINFTALYSSQSEDYDRDQVEGTGFPNDVLTNYQMNTAALVEPSSTYYKQNLISQMGRLNYGYNSRYLLTLTARRDGYSGFGVDTRYGVFPSAAVAWNISEENFMHIDLINNLKLRASYGLNGNQAVGPYTTLATLGSANYVSGSTVLPGFVPTGLANPNLGWESTKSFTVGLDFAILKNRIHGSVDVYSASTSDLLLRRAISPVQGIPSIIQNIGKTKNNGFEVALNTTNIDMKEFTWKTNLNFSHNENRIVDIYGDGKDDVGNRWFIGKPIRVIYGLQMDGIYRTQEEIVKSPQPSAKPGDVRVVDIDNNGVINTASDRTIIGLLDPKLIYGITNTFSYKGISLMIFLQGLSGVTKDNPLQDDAVFSSATRNTTKKDWFDAATNPNGTHSANNTNSNPLNANYYENGSYARLKDVSLAYTLPSSVLSAAKLTSVKVYITGRNLATFTKYKGLDPELSNQYGIPLQREIIAGLTIGL